MPTRKIAVTIDEYVLGRLEQLVHDGRYANRSKAIETAVREQVARADRSRLIRELAVLDPIEEQELAEESISADADEWPEY